MAVSTMRQTVLRSNIVEQTQQGVAVQTDRADRLAVYPQQRLLCDGCVHARYLDDAASSKLLLSNNLYSCWKKASALSSSECCPRFGHPAVASVGQSDGQTSGGPPPLRDDDRSLESRDASAGTNGPHEMARGQARRQVGGRAGRRDLPRAHEVATQSESDCWQA